MKIETKLDPPIKVLVVDNSPSARKLLIDILSTDNKIKVIGEAINGQDALKKVQELQPHVVIMDVEMPVMNGLEATERIMAFKAVPILIVTTRGNVGTAYSAISKGALDLIEKPDIRLENAAELIHKVKLLSKVKVITHPAGKYIERKRIGRVTIEDRKSGSGTRTPVIAIAASTGGPKALAVLLSELPEDFPCPIVIAQHMGDGFIPGLARWLNSISKLSIKEGLDRETITAGKVYISPSERHMKIGQNGKILLVERQPGDIYRPSCDLLLSSVASTYGADSIGVILTGMGDDGVLGMKKIKGAGGITLAQDERSSLIFGMPKMAIESGCIDKVLPLQEIATELVRLTLGGEGKG
jgi:two-component system chemotaxis response regulator CheB